MKTKKLEPKTHRILCVLIIGWAMVTAACGGQPELAQEGAPVTPPTITLPPGTELMVYGGKGYPVSTAVVYPTLPQSEDRSAVPEDAAIHFVLTAPAEVSPVVK